MGDRIKSESPTGSPRNAHERFDTPNNGWLKRLLTRKPRMVAAIALANKMARGLWAMMTKQEDYRHPVAAMA